MKLHNCFLALQWGGATCGCPHDDLRLAVRVRPLTSGLWSHWGVGSASPFTWSLHSQTSDNVASLQKYKGIPARQMKASLAPFTCLVSTHRVCYCYPFKWCLQLTPNTSPSKLRFNPDELNLWSLGGSYSKNVTLVNWGWSFACSMSTAAKDLRR
jgi:hypothetical protein